MSNMPSWDEDLTVALDAGFHNIIVHGDKSGTGKTTSPQVYAKAKGTLFSGTTFHDATQADEIRGNYLYRGDASGMEWVDGCLAQAWRASMDGTRVIFVANEVGRASDETLSALLQGMEDVGGLWVLPNGERLVRSKSLQIVCTSNSHPTTFEEALRQRFVCDLEADVPAAPAIARLSPELQAAAFASITIADTERRTSIRQWYQYDDATKNQGLDAATAARLCWGRARGPEIVRDLKLNQDG